MEKFLHAGKLHAETLLRAVELIRAGKYEYRDFCARRKTVTCGEKATCGISAPAVLSDILEKSTVFVFHRHMRFLSLEWSNPLGQRVDRPHYTLYYSVQQ